MQEEKRQSRKKIGRPKTSPLDPKAQARERKRRQRLRLAEQGLVKLEVLVPAALRDRIEKAAGGKPIAALGEEAFRLWLHERGAKGKKANHS